MKIELTVSELKDLLETKFAIDEDVPVCPAKEGQLNRAPGADPVPAVIHDVIYHLFRDEKSLAIKRYKIHYHLGLKDSIEAVNLFKESLVKFFP